MIGWLALLQLCLLSATFFAAALVLVCTALRHLERAALARMAPKSRARWLRLLAVAPTMLAPALVALCFLPAAFERDHCTTHDDVHAHFCVRHLTHGYGGFYGWIVLGALGLIVAHHAMPSAWKLQRAQRVVQTLRSVSRFDSVRRAWLLDAPVAFSFTAGVLRPRIFISAGMVSALAAEQLLAVLEHERSHVRRRDTLWRLIVQALSIPYMLAPRWRDQLLHALDLAVEQACDEDAAHAVGDRLAVADALVTCARALAAAPLYEGLVSSFVNRGDVGERVESLAADPRTCGVRRGAAAIVTALTFSLALVSASGLHEATETLLSFLAR